MRYNNFSRLDIGIEENLKGITQCCGEMTQLESTMYLLDGLMSWCEICFNNEIEERDYKLLVQAYELLEKVHKSYEDNYN